MDLNHLRKEYNSKRLTISSMHANPFFQFNAWLQEAIKKKLIEPNAMTLSTATKEGKPSSRVVLLKEVDDEGLLFYTNYESRKGKELIENPFASLNFYWKELERQLTIEGTIQKLSTEKSTTYFHSRPRASQLSAWVSSQGNVISSHEWMEDRFSELQKEFEGKEIPLPPYWGGFRLVPTLFIFWQGQRNRLHDRFRYQKNNEEWKIDQIAP